MIFFSSNEAGNYISNSSFEWLKIKKSSNSAAQGSQCSELSNSLTLQIVSKHASVSPTIKMQQKLVFGPICSFKLDNKQGA